MHFLTVFWKVLFAFVPPTDYWNGWACFVVSIIMIGVLTAFIGDLASHFGCTIGLKDSVTAVVFVALGTSVPGEREGSGWHKKKKNTYACDFCFSHPCLYLHIVIYHKMRMSKHSCVRVQAMIMIYHIIMQTKAPCYIAPPYITFISHDDCYLKQNSHTHHYVHVEDTHAHSHKKEIGSAGRAVHVHHV